jgi:hypothetical protein
MPTVKDSISDCADRAWPRAADDGLYRRQEAVSLWDQSLVNLMDHPKLLPVMVELLGSRLKIDHDYCISMQKGALSQTIHGGPRRMETDHWYYYADGVMRLMAAPSVERHEKVLQNEALHDLGQ